MAIDDIPLSRDPRDCPDPAWVEPADVVPGYPGEAAERASDIAAVLSAVRRLPQICANLTDTELTAAVRSLAGVMQHSEAAIVTMTSDAITRGAIDRSTAAGPTQWVERLSRNEAVATVMGAGPLAGVAGPLILIDEGVIARDADADGDTDVPASGGFEPSQATRIAKLADAVRSPFNRVLAGAIASGAVNTTVAKAALDNVDKVADVLPKNPLADVPLRDQVFGYFLLLPPGSGSRAVRELTRRIIAEYKPEELNKSEDTFRKHESVSWSNLPEGMTRLTADLSPDNAEIMKHAIQALAAPSPGSDCCEEPHHRHAAGSRKTGDEDTRTPGKRRADALVALVKAGAGVVDDDPDVKTSGSAKIVVTIDYLALVAMLTGTGGDACTGTGPGTGAAFGMSGRAAADTGFGAGVTEAGTTITPDTVRQLACDAQIIPMVLGAKNEPLNVGRAVRLVEKSLRRAVIHRDKHCTFDGCTRPPAMCEVHHVIPWWQGGETSLLNSALLCSTHHRIVHRNDLTAMVTSTAVTWHHHADSGFAA